MDELFGWLARLEALTESGEVAITERMNRVLAPSTFDFDCSIVRVADGHQEAYSFGRLPGRLSVLCWPDASSPPVLAD